MMVTFNGGQRTDSRTRQMLAEAEKRSGREIVVVQGSYSHGRFSAGTHSGGGVVDIRTWNQPSQAAITELVRWLREVGFAAWQRPDMGGGPHIHAVAISCKDLHSSARAQVRSYQNGRDGLARNGKDTGPKVSFRSWEQYKKFHRPKGKPKDKPKPPPKEWDELATKQELREVFLATLRSPQGRHAVIDALIVGFRHNSEFKDEFRKAVGDGMTIAHRHREDYEEAFETDVRQAVRKED